MKYFSDIWEAIVNGTVLTVGDITYRIDSTDIEQMHEDTEDYCVVTHCENTDEVQYWYFNEIEALVSQGVKVEVKYLCQARYKTSASRNENLVVKAVDNGDVYFIQKALLSKFSQINPKQLTKELALELHSILGKCNIHSIAGANTHDA